MFHEQSTAKAWKGSDQVKALHLNRMHGQEKGKKVGLMPDCHSYLIISYQFYGSIGFLASCFPETAFECIKYNTSIHGVFGIGGES